MKSFYLFLLVVSLSFVGFSAKSTAQNTQSSPIGSIVTDRDLPDFIVLRDGMSARCRVITYLAGYPVKVLLADAKVRVYRPEEVLRVERGKRAVAPARTTTESLPALPVVERPVSQPEVKPAAPVVAKVDTAVVEPAPVAPAANATYDVVVLKSGRVLKCKVLESGESGVQIEMPDGTIYYYRSADVARVDRRSAAKPKDAPRDMIVLKNGQKVPGTVLERRLDAPIKLRSVHGQIFMYRWEDVERILIDKNNKSDEPAETTDTRKMRLGFTAELGLGYGLEQNRQLVGEMNPEFALTVGARVGRIIYLGVGATVQRYDRTEIMPITPMVLGRIDYPLRGKFAPFADVRWGYSVNTVTNKKNYPEMAAFFGGQIGVRYGKFTFGVGAAYHQVKKSIRPNAGKVAPDGSYGKRVIPATGWKNQPEFTLRLGYQF